MKIEQQKIGTVDIFTPVGALVDQDVEAFIHQLSHQINTGNPRMVLSMQNVPYMDSAALEGFLDLSQCMKQQAVEMKLAQVTQTCREIFELTGLSNQFRFFEDIQDAVKSFL